MSLEIRQVSLAQLLSQSRPYQMARYQRHYEWGRKEMDLLVEDLHDAYADHLDDPGRGAFHFLGNIILYPSPTGALEVVDGQQRLASLTVMIAAARDLTRDPVLGAELDRLVFMPDQVGQPRQSRLRLHRGDHEFLESHILKGTTAAALGALGKQEPPGAECLRANAFIAFDRLSARPAELADFIRFAMAQSRFAELLVGDEDDAFRIFETVNSRGRPIASEDVLRYALVEYATSDTARRDDYLARWDAVESELGPRGMKRFIGGWRARLVKGERPRRALHRIVLESFSSPAEARSFLDSELSGDLADFRQIVTADVDVANAGFKQKIDTVLRSLSLLDFDDWLPVVSELIARGRSQPERLAADLARVERLAWFYYLHHDDKGVYQDRRNRFDDLMKKVADLGTFASMPPRALLNDEQRAKMRDIVQERLDAKWIPLRSLLERLEMALSPDGRGLGRENVTIEHILPLRPSARGWLSLYDDSLRTVTEWAERIGNLCLVPPELNTQLGNRIYSSKRKMFLDCGWPQRARLAADIATETMWTRDVIERRSKRLLKVFCDTFDVHLGRR